MTNRRKLIERACQLEHFFRLRKHFLLSFEQLLALQQALNQGDMDAVRDITRKYSNSVDSSHEPRIPDGRYDSSRSIFLLKKSRLLACIPLKTGTTNWQKAFMSIMVYEKTGSYLDSQTKFNVFKRGPPGFNSNFLPDYHASFFRGELNESTRSCIKSEFTQAAKNEKFIRFMSGCQSSSQCTIVLCSIV